jgi:hypothetical protein
MNVYHSIDIDFILTKTDHRLLQAPEQGKHPTPENIVHCIR